MVQLTIKFGNPTFLENRKLDSIPSKDPAPPCKKMGMAVPQLLGPQASLHTTFMTVPKGVSVTTLF